MVVFMLTSFQPKAISSETKSTPTPTSTSNQTTTSTPPTPSDLAKYRLLITVLREAKASTGKTAFTHNELALVLNKKAASPYPGKLKAWLKGAEEARVTQVTGKKGKISLAPNLPVKMKK